jgi:hypothetical protein
LEPFVTGTLMLMLIHCVGYQGRYFETFESLSRSRGREDEEGSVLVAGLVGKALV